MDQARSRELHEVSQQIEKLLHGFSRQEREAIATMAGKMLELNDIEKGGAQVATQSVQ